MKLQYIQPCVTTIEVEMHERLLFGSPLTGTSLDDITDGSGDEAGMTEKFLSPIWGDDAAADEGNMLSPW